MPNPSAACARNRRRRKTAIGTTGRLHALCDAFMKKKGRAIAAHETKASRALPNTRFPTQMEDELMSKPIDTVKQLIDALNRGDLDGALEQYEHDAVLVAQSGDLSRG